MLMSPVVGDDVDISSVVFFAPSCWRSLARSNACAEGAGGGDGGGDGERLVDFLDSFLLSDVAGSLVVRFELYFGS